MKSLQDKICDTLTLVGLLGVIGLGSASLLPESEDHPKEVAPIVESGEDSASPADTLEEIHTTLEVVERTEEPTDTILTDSTDVLLEEPIDTVSVHTESHTEKHEDTDIQHDKHAAEEHNKEAKPKDEKEVHKENLME